MHLRRWILAIAIVLSFFQRSFAQKNDWAVMNQLLSGQRIKVETVDHKSHVGNVQLATEDAIQIGNRQLIQKQDVQRVLVWSPGRHGRNALIGLGIGAGVGAVSGATCNPKDSFFNQGECIAVFAPFFGGLGAGIGALLPSHGRWHEVYQRK